WWLKGGGMRAGGGICACSPPEAAFKTLGDGQVKAVLPQNVSDNTFAVNPLGEPLLQVVGDVL
ncbi:hypothetical protein, partial [Micromonospora sp. KC721]|uniref:hypothetical protein n=1 Tax=Micromonospora sp. KC721 TaxID=2530380 RepID=UPI001A9D1D87